jgi:DNA-binding transcriptional ArsR family regulator
MKIQYLGELPASMRPAAAVFSALGDPNRQRILLLFEPGEWLSIKEIAELFTLSRSAMVHHLHVLEEAGIVRRRREGKTVLFTPNPGPVLQAMDALREYIQDVYPEETSGKGGGQS